MRIVEETRLSPGHGASLRTRSRTCTWLARALGSPGPAGEPPQAAETEPFSSALRRLQRLDEWATPEDLEDRECERVRLVVNAPGGIALPLEASWWLDGDLGGPTARAAAAFQRGAGLRAVAGGGGPDSLPALLELLHVVLQHQVAAALTDEPELLEHARRSEAELLERFLVPWIPRACAAGREATQSPWWRSVLDLLEGLVAGEAERLGEAPGA